MGATRDFCSAFTQLLNAFDIVLIWLLGTGRRWQGNKKLKIMQFLISAFPTTTERKGFFLSSSLNEKKNDGSSKSILGCRPVRPIAFQSSGWRKLTTSLEDKRAWWQHNEGSFFSHPFQITEQDKVSVSNMRKIHFLGTTERTRRGESTFSNFQRACPSQRREECKMEEISSETFSNCGTGFSLRGNSRW